MENGGKLQISYSAQEFRKRVVNFVVSTDQPFTIVESTEFRELITHAGFQNTKFNIPGADTARRDIRETFTEMKLKLVTKLTSFPNKVSFTIDC